MTFKWSNQTIVAHFWARVDRRGPDDCWLWLGACSDKGYGVVRRNKHLRYAHREAARLVGMICDVIAPTNLKSDGFVLHRCDNKKCCNPKHLYVGTYSQNTKDGYDRGLAKRRNAKLTNDQVREIRSTYIIGNVSTYELGQRYGVSDETVRCVVLRKSYRSVK